MDLKRPAATFAAVALAVATAAGAGAAEVEICMLNKGAAGVMVFEPALVMIAPGDTVRFVPTDTRRSARYDGPKRRSYG